MNGYYTGTFLQKSKANFKNSKYEEEEGRMAGNYSRFVRSKKTIEKVYLH